MSNFKQKFNPMEKVNDSTNPSDIRPMKDLYILRRLTYIDYVLERGKVIGSLEIGLLMKRCRLKNEIKNVICKGVDT